MENNPTQQNSPAPPPVNDQTPQQAPEPVFSSSPAVMGSVNSPPQAFSADPGIPSIEPKPSRKPRNLTGILSLLFGLSSLGIFVLLIFVTKLVSSLTMAYVWFFVISVISITGLIFGILALRGKSYVNILGLIGLVTAIVMCIGCITVGSYYIKIQSVLSGFSNSVNNTEFNSSGDLNNFQNNSSDSNSQ